MSESIYGDEILDEVIDACIKHLRDHPNDHEKLFYMGNAFFIKNQYDKASFCYIKAVNKSPKNAVYYAHLGHAYRELGDKDQAVASYESVLRLNPRFADAHF
ncbi:MAG: tetratricopeptide repeat protein, partial [Bacteroidales bacterium]|nr:tetratricopeptide repeat protein [Bacteroidales bacterium]